MKNHYMREQAQRDAATRAVLEGVHVDAINTHAILRRARAPKNNVRVMCVRRDPLKKTLRYDLLPVPRG